MKVYSTRSTLADIKGELKTVARARILKDMQIVLNARERNTKHIPEGTLMNQKVKY